MDLYQEAITEAAGSDTHLPHHDTDIDPGAYLEAVYAIHSGSDGAAYWQEKEMREAVTPLLAAFDPADEAALRDGPLDRFAPDAYGPENRTVSKSSGTTGPKKRMPWGSDINAATADWYNWNLDQYDTGDGDWLVSGPYGLYETHFSDMAADRGADTYFTGVETRGLKDLMAAKAAWDESRLRNLHQLPKLFQLGARMKPTMQAVEDDLSAEYVENIASAPQFVERMHGLMSSPDTPAEPEDIDTILLSATSIDTDTVDHIESLYEEADAVPMYATSFTGPAFDHPDTDHIVYYPNTPLVRFDVVDPETGDPVEYHERGQVVIHRTGPDFFWPNQFERESAIREPPREPYDWDGISAIAPLDS